MWQNVKAVQKSNINEGEKHKQKRISFLYYISWNVLQKHLFDCYVSNDGKGKWAIKGLYFEIEIYTSASLTISLYISPALQRLHKSRGEF